MFAGTVYTAGFLDALPVIIVLFACTLCADGLASTFIFMMV
jgi:hypothetical protein